MYVGGSSSSFELVDPTGGLSALGFASPANVTGGQPALATTPFGTAFGTPPVQFGTMGGGFVGGSWSPEPPGTSQVLYGHYATQPAVAFPQALYGQQATTFAPATTTPAATTPAAAPAGGQAQQPAAQQQDKAEPKKPAPKPEPKNVTVKSGDTLSAIAAKHGISWEKLYQANKAAIGSNPNLIRPGLELKIPAK